MWKYLVAASLAALPTGPAFAQNAQTEVSAPVPQKAKLPGSLAESPMLDGWIRIAADGVTVFTGKAELGQGIRTAMAGIRAAMALVVDERLPG